MTVCHGLGLYPVPIWLTGTNIANVSCHYLISCYVLKNSIISSQRLCFPNLLQSSHPVPLLTLPQFAVVPEFYLWFVVSAVCIALLHGNNIFCVIHCHCGRCYRINIVVYTPQEWRSYTSELNHPPLSPIYPSSWDHDRGGNDKDLFSILQLCLIICSY